jgi:glycogen debranching enzyme
MRRTLLLLALSLTILPPLRAQQTLEPLDRFPLAESPNKISEFAVPRRPFTVVGERGAVLGQQDGSFELWTLPIKVLQHAHLTAELDGYGVPIELNPLASTIEVSPDRTTITYSHSAIVVRQEMFVVRGGGVNDPAAVIFFSIDSTRSGTITLDFEAVMAPMWPAAQHGSAGASWVSIGNGGGFLLATDDPTLYGVVAMPDAKSGTLAPYQERPKKHPLEFRIKFDATRARKQVYPLIVAISDGKTPINSQSQEKLVQQVVDSEKRIPALYEQTAKYQQEWGKKYLRTETPDRNFDLAIAWAEKAINDSQIRFHDEKGLTAGWFTSADSLRPGFGWFFGRDTLWSLFAIHSFGDFELSRSALEFLIRRQRDDGKMMHEFSQTADRVDWKSFPYWYASADATPLFVIAMEDYLRASGDIDFVRKHWDSVKRAYRFTRTHDTDGDGIYDNSQGTGWVESWPPGMPHQEIYLAALDQQSAEAYSRLAALMNESGEEAKSAKGVADSIRTKLASYKSQDGFYAFSRNADGSYDSTATVFPSVAWWNGRLSLATSDGMFSRWSSDEFLTDWGLREVSGKSNLYDPISYHQGSVWPLFTGWVSIAEYRAGRPLAGFEEFLSNERLTFLSDVGAATELLSGDYYEPLGRSSSHQVWSSAMVLTPAIRGVFGIEGDALHHRLQLNPHLPAEWDRATVHNVPFGNTTLDISFHRRAGNLEASIESSQPIVLCVDTKGNIDDMDCKQALTIKHDAHIPLPGVEVGIVDENPQPGERTSGLKVLEERYGAREIALKLQAPAGSTKELSVRFNGTKESAIRVEGGSIVGNRVKVQFPQGEGYVTQAFKIRW